MPMHNTLKMEQIECERANEIREIIKTVYDALKVKGYNPVNQLVGYIQSGDPTYITKYNNARSLIAKVENDEIIEELVKAYIADF